MSNRNRKFYSMVVNGRTADIDIYGYITSEPWPEFGDVSAASLSQQISGLNVDVINVNINSYGGEVAEGLAIYNMLKRNTARIVTRCDGFACSIASVIFAAGDERIMSDSSLLMIHNAWLDASGDGNALRKIADDCDKITQASIKAYMQIVSISEDELRAMMDAETWISPAEAYSMGFCTSIDSTDAPNFEQSARNAVFKAVYGARNHVKFLNAEGEDEDEGDPTSDQNDSTDDGENGDSEPENDEISTDDAENGDDEPKSAENDENSPENDENSTENDQNDDENSDDSDDEMTQKCGGGRKKRKKQSAEESYLDRFFSAIM